MMPQVVTHNIFRMELKRAISGSIWRIIKPKDIKVLFRGDFSSRKHPRASYTMNYQNVLKTATVVRVWTEKIIENACGVVGFGKEAGLGIKSFKSIFETKKCSFEAYECNSFISCLFQISFWSSRIAMTLRIQNWALR